MIYIRYVMNYIWLNQEDKDYLIASGIRKIMNGFINSHRHVIIKPSVEMLIEWYCEKLSNQTHCPHCNSRFSPLGDVSASSRNIDRINNNKSIESLDDLEMICKSCNSGKSDSLREQYRDKMFLRMVKNMDEKPKSTHPIRDSLKNTKSFYDENDNFIQSNSNPFKWYRIIFLRLFLRFP